MLLLVTDSYSRYWQAVPLPGSSQSHYQVLPADYTLIGVPLDAGHHLIRLEYAPPGWVIGRWISLASLVIYLAAPGYVPGAPAESDRTENAARSAEPGSPARRFAILIIRPPRMHRDDRRVPPWRAETEEMVVQPEPGPTASADSHSVHERRVAFQLNREYLMVSGVLLVTALVCLGSLRQRVRAR